MKYFLYKLTFQSAVRFGGDFPGAGLEKGEFTCRADTFFGALCLELIKTKDAGALEEFANMARRGELLLSDLMPYAGHELYLPKPFVFFDPGGHPAASGAANEKHQAKALKELKYIPASSFDQYLKSLRLGKPPEVEQKNFAMKNIRVKVAITGKTVPEPYHMCSYLFKGTGEEKTGLYFILALEKENYLEKFNNMVLSLGMSGIGGKKNSACGGFGLEDDVAELDGLYEIYGPSDLALGRMLKRKANLCMALSPVIPEPLELDGLDLKKSFYGLTVRGGFAMPAERNKNPLKKKTVAAFASGSCFPLRLKGAVLDVAPPDFGHSVYRYGKGLYIGLGA